MVPGLLHPFGTGASQRKIFEVQRSNVGANLLVRRYYGMKIPIYAPG